MVPNTSIMSGGNISVNKLLVSTDIPYFRQQENDRSFIMRRMSFGIIFGRKRTLKSAEFGHVPLHPI